LKKLIANIKAFLERPKVHRLWANAKNKYILATIAFVVWILFIDENNMIDRFFAWRKYKQLEHTRQYFEDKIKKDHYEMEELDKNKNLERLAREKYLMKKKNEDIYIIKEDK
jgi:hypothetical protein